MTTPGSSDLGADERLVMGRWMPRRPTAEIVRGQGSWLEASDGRRYLDLTSGYGTCPLGHSHPRLVSALKDQAESLWAAPSFLLSDVRGGYLEMLADRLPAGLGHVFLCNSGTEAVEAGLKFARIATSRSAVVAVKGSFHGRTLGALAATSNPKARKPEEVLSSSGVRFVDRDDIAGLEQAIDDRCALVLVEVIQGEGGVVQCSQEFLAAAQDLAAARGALLMVDEIQTGMGRTGELFASSWAGLRPDLMALAKGLGGGFPIGALAYGSRVHDSLSPGAHGSTFGGNALACAVGRSVLEVFAEEQIVGQARDTGGWFGERLKAGLGGLPGVRDIRGRGMMWAVQLRQRAGKTLAALTRDHGVLVLPAGPNVIRFLPPLNADRSDLQLGVDALADALGDA